MNKLPTNWTEQGKRCAVTADQSASATSHRRAYSARCFLGHRHDPHPLMARVLKSAPVLIRRRAQDDSDWIIGPAGLNGLLLVR